MKATGGYRHRNLPLLQSSSKISAGFPPQVKADLTLQVHKNRGSCTQLSRLYFRLFCQSFQASAPPKLPHLRLHWGDDRCKIETISDLSRHSLHLSAPEQRGEIPFAAGWRAPSLKAAPGFPPQASPCSSQPAKKHELSCGMMNL